MNTSPELSRQRQFVSPEPGDDWGAVASRVLPDEPLDEAVQALKSWNLHLMARMPPGEFTGSDVLFVEAPLRAEESMLDFAERSDSSAPARG